MLMLGEHVSLSSSLGAALCGTERRLDTRFVTAREADRSDPPKPSEHGIGSGQETAPRRLFRRRRRRARSPARAGVTTESSDVLLATSGSLVRAEPTPAFVFARVFGAGVAAYVPTGESPQRRRHRDRDCFREGAELCLPRSRAPAAAAARTLACGRSPLPRIAALCRWRRAEPARILSCLTLTARTRSTRRRILRPVGLKDAGRVDRTPVRPAQEVGRRVLFGHPLGHNCRASEFVRRADSWSASFLSVNACHRWPCASLTRGASDPIACVLVDVR